MLHHVNQQRAIRLMLPFSGPETRLPLDAQAQLHWHSSRLDVSASSYGDDAMLMHLACSLYLPAVSSIPLPMRKWLPSTSRDSNRQDPTFDLHHRLVEETPQPKVKEAERKEMDLIDTLSWFRAHREQAKGIIIEALQDYLTLLREQEKYSHQMMIGESPIAASTEQADHQERAFVNLRGKSRQLNELLSNATHFVNEMRRKGMPPETDERCWELSKYEKDLFYLSSWAEDPFALQKSSRSNQRLLWQYQLEQTKHLRKMVEGMMATYTA